MSDSKSKTDKVEDDKRFYNKNLKKKLESSIDDIKDLNLDLAHNVNLIKGKFDSFFKKQFNFNLIDGISQKLYTNPYHLIKLEFLQYIIFIILIYYYNPFNIESNHPVFTKLLVLVVAFIYIMLFMFIKSKIDANEDVDLIEITESDILSKFLYTIGFFVAFMFAIKGTIWVLRNTSLITSIRNMMSILIVVGVLSIVYLFAKNKINNAKNAPGRTFSTLLIKIIMYLPCLLVDMVEYAKYELNLTTKPVWILLGVETIFVGLWLLIPYMFDKISSYGGLKLLNKPVYLTREYTIGNFNQLHKTQNDEADADSKNIDQLYSDYKNKDIKKNMKNTYTPTEDGYEWRYIKPTADASNGWIKMKISNPNINEMNNINEMDNDYTDPNMPSNPMLAKIYKQIKEVPWIKMKLNVHPQYTDTETQRFRYKYGLTGWFYINPQPTNTRAAYTKYTNIMKYGNKVMVEYNAKLGNLRITGSVASSKEETKNENVIIYETTEVQYQKWNNIVVNYDNGFIDVFLNGDLVGSISGVAPYMSFDNIIVGEARGLQGAICNVTYYSKPLTKDDIVLNYKTLRDKKVPYIWRASDDINFNIEKNKNPNNKFVQDLKNLVGA